MPSLRFVLEARRNEIENNPNIFGDVQFCSGCAAPFKLNAQGEINGEIKKFSCEHSFHGDCARIISTALRSVNRTPECPACGVAFPDGWDIPKESVSEPFAGASTSSRGQT